MEMQNAKPVTNLHYLPGFFSEEETAKLLEYGAALPLTTGKIIGHGSDPDLVARRSEVRWLNKHTETDWLYGKFLDALVQLNGNSWNFDLYGIDEPLQYTEYVSRVDGHGFYDWHLDLASEGIAATRKLSFECMLNEDYEGGELSVRLGPEEYKVKLQRGDVVVFPSFLISKVYPVETGKRLSLVGWAAGPSFR